MTRALLFAGSLFISACIAVDAPSENIDGVDLGRSTHEQIMLNHATTEAILINALTGSEATTSALVNNPLSSATFDPEVGHPALEHVLLDPNSRQLLGHIVECALTSEHELTWQSFAWQGKHGLCPAWATGAASQECREVVSACVLARNNPQGHVVTMSVRGEHASGSAIALGNQVFAQTTKPLANDQGDAVLIDSFVPCNSQGVTRNCGWRAQEARVGVCSPAEKPAVNMVMVGAGATPAESCKGELLGSSTGDTVLRVCEGVSGCDSGQALAQADNTCGTAPAVQFACPASGIFTVMTAPSNPANAQVTATAAAQGLGVEYPVSEQNLFSIREGAFYGNGLLQPGKRSAAFTVTIDSHGRLSIPNQLPGPITVVYDNLWACHAPEWTQAQGYMHHRLCATYQDKVICAAELVGPCSSGPQYPEAMCDSADGPPVAGDMDYQDCSDLDANIHARPMTVFLKDACDLAPPGQPGLCERREITLPSR